MTGTLRLLVRCIAASFLWVHVVVFLSSTSSSSCSTLTLITAFTASAPPAAADIRRRHRLYILPSSSSRAQSSLSSSSSSSTSTTLNVVMSRSSSTTVNGSTAANGATAKNGKHSMLQQQQEDVAAAASKNRRIPFIIQQLPNKKKSDFSPLDDRLFEEIAQMCINVFFNDNCVAQSKPAPLWKEVQLAYLRKLQQGDLKQRRQNNPDTNLMYIAREVVPVTTTTTSSSSNYNLANSNSNSNKYNAQNQPLLLDLSQVYNLPRRSSSSSGPLQLFNYMNNNNNNNGHDNDQDHDDIDYVCGRILGFVEVTQRPYGLGIGGAATAGDEATILNAAAGAGDTSNSGPSSASSSYHVARRPILTNLSVRYEARGSGVGSCLLQALEQGVLTQWTNNNKGNNHGNNNREIILEVEDDNEKAIQFYQKRGYQPIFQDPASRRYDTNGLLLRQMRCNRIIMRKNLLSNNNKSLPSSSSIASSSNGDELAFLVKAFQRLKESVLSF
jgi:GNAT superfamily N-acetyltransferase